MTFYQISAVPKLHLFSCLLVFSVAWQLTAKAALGLTFIQKNKSHSIHFSTCKICISCSFYWRGKLIYWKVVKICWPIFISWNETQCFHKQGNSVPPPSGCQMDKSHVAWTNVLHHKCCFGDRTVLEVQMQICNYMK